MPTRDEPDAPAGSRRALRAAIVSTVLAIAVFAAALCWPAEPQGVFQLGVYRFLSGIWPVLLAIGLGLFAYERFLHRRLAREIQRATGLRAVQTLLPQQVMTTLLDSIYGPNLANDDVVTGVLGGQGLQPHGSDLTISTNTTVAIRLQAVDRASHYHTMTVTYAFSERVAADRFVIFATSNPLLRDSITSACRLPLYDTVFIPDQSQFQQSVDDMLPSVNLEIDFVDHEGNRRIRWSNSGKMTEVKVHSWADYLQFFRNPVGTLPQQRPGDYLSELRILEYDLNGSPAERIAPSVERLAFQFTTLQRRDDQYCFWQAPFPCYVDEIQFNILDMQLDDEAPWEFRLVPFTFRSHARSSQWLAADQVTALNVRSWMLPGHGVILMWRPRREAGNGSDLELPP